MSTAKPEERPAQSPPPQTRAERNAQWAKERKEQEAKDRLFLLLIWARFKFWGWTICTKAPVAVVYLMIVPSGIIYLAPDMGTRLWKVPFFFWLNYLEATHRITLAQVFSLIPLVATWFLWSLLLSMYLAPDRFDEKYKRFRVDQNKRVILIIGIVVILADAGIFGASFSLSSWGASRFSATVVLATALYCAVFAFVSLISLFLGDEVTVLKEKVKETTDVQVS